MLRVIYGKCLYDGCCYAECPLNFKLSVIGLNFVIMNIIMPSDVMISHHDTFILSVIISVCMLSVFMLSVVMIDIIMLSDAMHPKCIYAECRYAKCHYGEFRL